MSDTYNALDPTPAAPPSRMRSSEPAPTPKGDNLDDMVSPAKGLTAGLADIGREKAAASDRLYSGMEKTLDQDQARMQRAYSHTGIEPETLRPWNEQEQSRKLQTDPLESFGSLGSVFAIVASAFTHAPMTNALNGSAAAINAIKAGNDKEYERAHEAWKENMELALKRHEIMRDSYRDAATLMQTNMAAGQAKLQMLTAKYGDKQMQYLLENGMSKEMFELMDSRNRAMTGAMEAHDKLDEHGFAAAVFKRQIEDSKNIQDPAARAQFLQAQFQNIYKPGKDPVEQQAATELFNKAAKEGRTPTVEELTKLKREMSPYGHGTGAAGGNTNLTVQRQNAAAADKYAHELRQQNPQMSEDEISDKRAERYAQLQSTSTPAPAGKTDVLKGLVDKTKYFEQVETDIEKSLAEHQGLTGLGGKILRPAESVANVLGSNSTAYHQFESRIAELQDWWTQIERESTTSGRGLSAQEDRVGKIIRGTNWGDTTKVTVERLREIMPIVKEMRQNFAKRGRFKIDEEPDKSAPSGKQPWENDPVVH